MILYTFKTIKKIQMWLSWTSVSGILHEDLSVHYIVDNNIATLNVSFESDGMRLLGFFL